MSLNTPFSVEQHCGPTLLETYQTLISSASYVEVVVNHGDTLAQIGQTIASIGGQTAPMDLVWEKFQDHSDEAKGQLVSALHQGFVTILSAEGFLSKRARDLLEHAVARSHEAMDLYLAQEKNALLSDPDIKDLAQEAFEPTPTFNPTKPKLGL